MLRNKRKKVVIEIGVTTSSNLNQQFSIIRR
jgi:hypothetical protein